jgi:hypothetical protein
MSIGAKSLWCNTCQKGEEARASTCNDRPASLHTHGHDQRCCDCRQKTIMELTR